MRVIVAGSDQYNNYEEVKKAIEESGFEITAIISGTAKGVDTLGEKWAEENGIEVERYPAQWNDLDVPNARIKTNKWGKEYNANAGFDRNEKMAEVGDALVAIDLNTPGTNNMIKKMKELNKPIFVHKPVDQFGYVF